MLPPHKRRSPSLNPKHPGVPSCRSQRITSRHARGSEHPQVRFVDLLLADQMGIPRGKRVTIDELEGDRTGGLLLPAIDVRARRARRHGAVDRSRLRRRRRGPDLPAVPGSLVARAVARTAKSRRCRSACTSTIAGRFMAIRDTCSSACCDASRSRPHAGHGGRARVLPGRPRAHGRGLAQPPRQPLSGRREFRRRSTRCRT